MEIIGTGILLTIGYFIAPLVVAAAFAIVVALSVGICNMFGGCKWIKT